MFTELKSEFPILFGKFQKGVRYINAYIASRGRDSYIAGEIDRFTREVMRPLDEAWDKMPKDEREKCAGIGGVLHG